MRIVRSAEQHFFSFACIVTLMFVHSHEKMNYIFHTAPLFCFRIGDDVFSETAAEQVGFFVVHKKVTIFSENGLANKGGLE